MKFKYLLNSTLSVNMAIDFGTENTLIYITSRGIVLSEPTYIAYDERTTEVVATGKKAKEMWGKTPEFIKVIRPVEKGVISNYKMAAELLKAFMITACERTLLKPRVIINVPSDSTDVEKRAVYDAARQAGAREVYMVDAPIAAASGAGCDISMARGMLIAEIGAGRCDVASISVGSTVVKKSNYMAGDAVDDEITKYMKQKYSLDIGKPTAQKIKCEIVKIHSTERAKAMTVSGCDSTTGLPKSVSVTGDEFKDILTPILKEIAKLIKIVIEDTPHDLQTDIIEDGILLTGGGAKLEGIEKFLRAELGIKVYITENMEECVIKGIGIEISKLDLSNNNYFYSVNTEQ